MDYALKKKWNLRILSKENLKTTLMEVDLGGKLIVMDDINGLVGDTRGGSLW